MQPKQIEGRNPGRKDGPMNADIDSIKAQIETLRQDINDLETQLPKWNPNNQAGAKKPRHIARRIKQSSQRLDTLVKENTFSTGT